MTIFTCSDTFEGILCGVYDAWMSKLGHANVKLEIENRGNIQMFAQYRTVEVTSEKTEKVISVICKKAGDQVYEHRAGGGGVAIRFHKIFLLGRQIQSSIR